MHYAFTTLDAVLMENLEKDAINDKMVSWRIQNAIIKCLYEFVQQKRFRFQNKTQLLQMRVLKDSLVNNFYFIV